MEEIKLSGRLGAIAELIPPYGGLADVGTDHGYIPLWLLQNGFKGSICATDIKTGPLETARSSARALGLEDKICFHLCDGLESVDAVKVQTIIIAGMGGKNIASILEAAPWTKTGRVMILQPMSKADRLRRWLNSNHYFIVHEALVLDGALYEIIVAVGGQDRPLSPAELFTGRFEQISASPLFPKKLELLIEKNLRAAEGLSHSSAADGSEKKHQFPELLKELRSMQERLKTGGQYGNC